LSWRRRWPSLPIRQRPWLRPHRLGEARDRFGVQAIGLGEPPGGAGEVADLARVDDHQRQAGGAERRGDGRLKAPGGLKHDQPRGKRGEAVGQRREAGGVAVESKRLPSRAHVHVEPALGDVDADEHPG
jgi:hypothetical protein